jgi:hypothetical protein
MDRLIISIARTLITALFFVLQSATAQIPPHAPGSICRTPQFWCWHNPPGPVNDTCFCPSPYGTVRGKLI